MPQYFYIASNNILSNKKFYKHLKNVNRLILQQVEHIHKVQVCIWIAVKLVIKLNKKYL